MPGDTLFSQGGRSCRVGQGGGEGSCPPSPCTLVPLDPDADIHPSCPRSRSRSRSRPRSRKRRRGDRVGGVSGMGGGVGEVGGMDDDGMGEVGGMDDDDDGMVDDDELDDEERGERISAHPSPARTTTTSSSPQIAPTTTTATSTTATSTTATSTTATSTTTTSTTAFKPKPKPQRRPRVLRMDVRRPHISLLKESTGISSDADLKRHLEVNIPDISRPPPRRSLSTSSFVEPLSKKQKRLAVSSRRSCSKLGKSSSSSSASLALLDPFSLL